MESEENLENMSENEQVKEETAVMLGTFHIGGDCCADRRFRRSRWRR